VNGGKGIAPGFPTGLKATCLDSSKRGDGHHGVFLVEDASDNKYIVKCYGRKRSKWREILGTLANYLAGKSSLRPLDRFETEKKVMKTWHDHGFHVFKQSEVEDFIGIKEPHLVLEYVRGQTLLSFFADPHVGKDEKTAMLRRFIPEWGRRHHLAMKSGNRLLIQEHPSFKHVFVNDTGQFFAFDFETVYQAPHRLASLIGREIAGYVRSLYKVTAPEEFSGFLDIIIQEYPHREYLLYPFRFFFRHPNPIMRMLYSLDRRRPRHQKRHSKYPVARMLGEHLRI
jgi:hypothetical protein